MKKFLRKLLKIVERIHESIEDGIAVITANYNKGEKLERFTRRLKI